MSGNTNHNIVGANGASIFYQVRLILMHELIGHAIPMAVGFDTGNAVENKVRVELHDYERKAEPDHDEY